MNRDLENTLDELGPGFREMVAARLAAAPEIAPSGRRDHASRRFAARRLAVRLAASLAVLAGGAWALGLARRPASRGGALRAPLAAYTAAYAGDRESLAAILSAQRPDGGWENDFLTRQNAAALRGSEDAACRIAYRRAVRYLRFRGLDPLTDEELRSRGLRAERDLPRLAAARPGEC